MRHALTLMVMGIAIVAAASQPKECNVEVTIKGRPDSKILLYIESGKDFRISGFHGGAIKDGQYTFTLPADTVHQYEVMFDDEMSKGSWRTRRFFSEPGTVRLIYHGQGKEDTDSIISDGPENKHQTAMYSLSAEKYKPRLNTIYASIDSLHANDAAYAPEVSLMMKKLKEASPDREADSLRQRLMEMRRSMGQGFYTPEYNRLTALSSEIAKQYYADQLAYVKEHPSVHSLAEIKSKLLSESDLYSTGDWIRAADTVVERMPQLSSHPYYQDIQTAIGGTNIKPGKKYPDMTIHRADGTAENIAALAGGKPAIVNLWASWCGPCRKHSKELIPVYEKYKTEGLKVIAVARERDNISDMELAMKADGYPWETFVDLNDADEIWRRNGAAYSGGRIILLDASGSIKAVDPTIDQVKSLMQEEFGF